MSDPTDAKARCARIDRMIEAYRVASQRRLMRRAMRVWRMAEAEQRLRALEAPPQRVH